MGKRRSQRIQNCGVHVGRNFSATNVNAITGNSSSSPASPVTSLRNYGIQQGARGIIKTKRLKIINNPSPTGASTAESQPAFRLNIPTPTRHFKGRRKTMEDVRDYFTNLSPQTDDCWERIAAIVGLGGMGKTETAYKFAADYKELFPNVAWINSETEQSCLTSFLDLGKQLGVVPKDMKTEDPDLNLVKEVYREMDKRDCGRVLLIFDNAIQLNSNGTEFGILNYLPRQDLLNRRFPYILLTTQTHYWDRGIIKFQVDELTEEESLDFFRSSFHVKAPECDEEFKKLHKILEGYPLAMNLAAAQIDYIPKKDTINHLKQQISNYIEKLVKQQDKILSQKMNRAWANSYNKTLSNVWQLTFERIEQEDDGRDALEVLQLMSFLHVPFWTFDIKDMLIHSSDFPPLSKMELELRMKKVLRVLERFYAVNILHVNRDNEEGFSCLLGIHRLVQLVVRQQMGSNKILERVLLYFAKGKFFELNITTALEEAIWTRQLSPKALTYVGILACHGFPAAREFVETREPVKKAKAATTIWRLYYLERGRTTLSENAIQVLRELIELTRSGEHGVEERCFFGEIAIVLLTHGMYFGYTKDDGTKVPGYFYLDSLNGAEELIAELILDDSWAQHSNCNNCKGGWNIKDELVSVITAKLTKTFVRTVSTLTVDVIAKTWFALFARRRRHGWVKFICVFWVETYKTFQSSDKETQSRIDALKKCLWSSGLGPKLSDVLVSIDFNETDVHCYGPVFFYLMSVGIDGMDLRDERVQHVLSSFCKMIAEIEKDPQSQQLLESLLFRLKFLDWLVEIPKFNMFEEPYFRWAIYWIPEELFPEFIRKYISSDNEVTQGLRNFCRLTENKKIEF